MAIDAPDYVQPVSIEAGEVVINPGSCPIPITPTAGSTFQITGPVTIEGATVNVPVDTSATPLFGSTCLYAQWNVPLSSGGTELGYMDVSKFASVFVAGKCLTANWALYVPSVTPDPASINVYEQTFNVYRGATLEWWFPVVGPLIRPRFYGPDGNDLNYLVIYGCTVPAPAYGGPRAAQLLLQGDQTVAAGSNAYWYSQFSVGAHMLTFYKSTTQTWNLWLEEFDWLMNCVRTVYYSTGTSSWVSVQVALGPYIHRIRVNNGGTSSLTASVTLVPL